MYKAQANDLRVLNGSETKIILKFFLEHKKPARTLITLGLYRNSFPQSLNFFCPSTQATSGSAVYRRPGWGRKQHFSVEAATFLSPLTPIKRIR